jgi:predicted nuclease with TOPRIM domain
MKTYAELEREVNELTTTLAEAVSDAATWKRRALEKEKPTRALGENIANAHVELSKMSNALKAVLIWHGAPVWTQEVKDQWDKLTGSSETSTKAMCDFIRSTLVNEISELTDQDVLKKGDLIMYHGRWMPVPEDQLGHEVGSMGVFYGIHPRPTFGRKNTPITQE